MPKLREGKWLCVVFLLSGLIVSSPQANAATFVVANGDVTALIAAINAANDEIANPGADTITLASGGIYMLTSVYDPVGVGVGAIGLPAIDTAIIINGNGATIQRDTTAPDFGLFATADTTADLTLNDMTLTNGRLTAMTTFGGAVMFGAGVGLIQDSIITGNTAYDGGGIANIGGDISIIRTTISNNTVVNSAGGGILTSYPMTITDSVFSGNSASSGAAISNQGPLTITNTLFFNNDAFPSQGGAISSSGDLTINDSTFTNNLGANGGGAIEAISGTVTITNTTFSNNHTNPGGVGGAIYTNAVMTISESIFSGNRADFGSGGAFYIGGGSVTLDNVTLSGNGNQGESGGAILNYGILTIINSTLNSNRAASGGGGGGAILNSGQFSITGSRLTGNTTDVSGSAILDTTGTATITGNCIVGNRADVISIYNAAASVMDARGNWWGSVDGPSGVGTGSGDSVNANVDFSGYLTARPSYCVNAISASSVPSDDTDIPFCSDFDGTTHQAVRARLQPGVFGVHCRVLAANHVFIQKPSEIGNIDVLNQGVITAVDVFSPSNADAAQTWMCLRGTGQMLFLDALTAPRTVRTLASTIQVDYTCATIPNIGTVVLVASNSTRPSLEDNNHVSLTNCRVTTTHAVRLRAEPTTMSALITTLPYDLALTATEREGNWLHVIYLDGQGWVSADYLTLSGDCGS